MMLFMVFAQARRTFLFWLILLVMVLSCYYQCYVYCYVCLYYVFVVCCVVFPGQMHLTGRRRELAKRAASFSSYVLLFSLC